MRELETVGRTIDDAVREALHRLGVERDDVDVEVLDEGSKGLFGLLGSRRARVRVQLKPGVEAGSVVAEAETVEDVPEPEHAEIDADAVRAQAAEAEAVIEEKVARAHEFIRGVLERMEVEAALETRRDDDGIVHVHIVGDDLGLIIGRRGQTLDAFQFLVNQAVNKDGGARARIVLDAGGYRARRAETLEALAQRMAHRAVRQRRNIALDPMNAFERRIVHMSLADDDAVETYSEGEDPHRHIIIAPKS